LKDINIINLMNSNKVNRMLEDNKKMRNKIFEYNEIVTLINKSIKVNETKIFKLCSHEWERDNECAFDDRCKNYCKKCGLWSNPYMYQ